MSVLVLVAHAGVIKYLWAPKFLWAPLQIFRNICGPPLQIFRNICRPGPTNISKYLWALEIFVGPAPPDENISEYILFLQGEFFRTHIVDHIVLTIQIFTCFIFQNSHRPTTGVSNLGNVWVGAWGVFW